MRKLFVIPLIALAAVAFASGAATAPAAAAATCQEQFDALEADTRDVTTPATPSSPDEQVVIATVARATANPSRAVAPRALRRSRTAGRRWPPPRPRAAETRSRR